MIGVCFRSFQAISDLSVPLSHQISHLITRPPTRFSFSFLPASLRANIRAYWSFTSSFNYSLVFHSPSLLSFRWLFSPSPLVLIIGYQIGLNGSAFEQKEAKRWRGANPSRGRFLSEFFLFPYFSPRRALRSSPPINTSLVSPNHMRAV